MNKNNDLNLKEIIKDYIKYWYWFAISMVLALIVSYIYLRYTTPQYAANAKIQILEEKSKSSELAILEEIDFLGSTKTNVEDELEIIKSLSNFMDVVKDLKLHINYRRVGRISALDLYKNEPVKLNFIEPDSIIYNSQGSFYIQILSESTFGFSNQEDEKMKMYTFGNKVDTKVGGIIITPRDAKTIKNHKGTKLMVSLAPVERVAQAFKRKVTVAQAAKNSSIINLGLRDASLVRAKDVLNTLIKVYNDNAISSKKEISDRTINFINDRISEIAGDLSNVDQTAQDFRTKNRITDIASEASMNLTVGSANEDQINNVNTQLSIANAMRDLVDDQGKYEVMPSNIGLNDASVNSAASKFNELVLERDRMLKTMNAQNPMILQLNQQIDGIRENMRSSLSSTTENLNIQLNSLRGRQARINSRIYGAPKYEKQLKDITRKQGTIEALYLYLMEKREQSGITLASTAPKSKLVEAAHGLSELPVAPSKSMSFLAALVIGFIIPFSVIYAYYLIDDKIHNKLQLEKLVANQPILAEIPKVGNGKDANAVILKNDRSVLAESFRILRTNLDFLIKTNKTKEHPNNVVFVSSSVSGEGKTFIASNLAIIFANTNKKVLLIGADIRNPKMFTFLSKKEFVTGAERLKHAGLGLTDFLHNAKVKKEEIINQKDMDGHNIDVIYSGKIPPNPSELAMSDRLGELLEFASKNYDYVVVDTAPLMIVTDTQLMSKHADHLIYVCRAGVTEKRVIEYPLSLEQDGKINGLTFVVNNVKSNDLGYGGKYGYGYGYGQKKSSKWKYVKKWIPSKKFR
ncbi:MAG: polysaccharide biosynthesis tyrosine autokinase [Flavobacteriaceae bacterium]|nr:polysaccharide biosynthesis tyrosine autokinase [Flavobacteriaceae bacterium]